ncbi:MAG: SDR family oxidoreductase [Acidobacteria bacterium]|nr:SDR family oxidoreductase [Acidobacteriota bacterium]
MPGAADSSRFPALLRSPKSRISIFRGDLTGKRFGLSDADFRRLIETTDSVIHTGARPYSTGRARRRVSTNLVRWKRRLLCVRGIITDRDDSVMSARSTCRTQYR